MIEILALTALLKPLPEYVVMTATAYVVSGVKPACEQIPYNQAHEMQVYRNLVNEIKQQRTQNADVKILEPLSQKLSASVSRLEVLSNVKWSAPLYDVNLTWNVMEDLVLYSVEQRASLGTSDREHPFVAMRTQAYLAEKQMEIIDFQYGSRDVDEEVSYVVLDSVVFASGMPPRKLMQVSFRKMMTAIEYCQDLPFMSIETILKLTVKNRRSDTLSQSQKFYLKGRIQ